MTTTRRDVVSGALFGTGGIVLFLHVSGFPVREGQPVAVSPGFYPRLLALTMIILAVIQVVGALLAASRRRAAVANGDDVKPEETTRFWKDRHAFGLFSLTLGSLVVYPFLLRLVGFTATGFVFIGVLVYALSSEHRSRKGLIVVASVTLGLALLTFVVFRLFLQIPFPAPLVGRL